MKKVYMKRIAKKEDTKEMIGDSTDKNTLLLRGESEEILLIIQESDNGPSFPDANVYEVLDSNGSWLNAGYLVFNNIPVSEEGRQTFENRFQNRPRLVEKEPGFQAIRVLRPTNSDTYIIASIWESEDAFEDWQTSKSFNKAHEKRGSAQEVNKQESIFPRPSYVTSYIPF